MLCILRSRNSFRWVLSVWERKVSLKNSTIMEYYNLLDQNLFTFVRYTPLDCSIREFAKSLFARNFSPAWFYLKGILHVLFSKTNKIATFKTINAPNWVINLNSSAKRTIRCVFRRAIKPNVNIPREIYPFSESHITMPPLYISTNRNPYALHALTWWKIHWESSLLLSHSEYVKLK